MIPTNLVIGPRSSGKSLCINQLLTSRPDAEKWGVFLNDRGITAIAGCRFDPRSNPDEGVWVEELSGGCVCCSLGLAFEPLLAKFIRLLRPDRLLIELNGTGNPAPILEKLRGRNFAGSLLMGRTLGLVNPDLLNNVGLLTSDAFRNQLQSADLIVWNSESSESLENEIVQGLVPKRESCSIYQLRLSHLA